MVNPISNVTNLFAMPEQKDGAQKNERSLPAGPNVSQFPEPAEIQKVVDLSNALLQEVNRCLHFYIDDSTQEVVIKIIDKDSGNLIKQIPSDEALSFIKQMQLMEGHKSSIIHKYI